MFITAKEAERMSLHCSNIELIEIMDRIKSTSERGIRSTLVQNNINQSTLKILGELGYRIENKNRFYRILW